MPQRASLYALIALVGGVILTAAAWFAGIGLEFFMTPAMPAMKVMGYIPDVPVIVEPGELPFSVHEAFLAFLYAAMFWVVLVPIAVWAVAAICVKWTANHAKPPSGA